MTRPLAALLGLMLLPGCPRGSGIPLREFTIDIQPGGEVTLTGDARSPFASASGELRVRGPARLTALRDGTVAVDGVPVERKP